MSNNYWAIKLVLWLVFALAVLALLVFPLLTSLLYNYAPDSPIGSLKYFQAIETIQTWMMRILTGAWFFFLGSCFASFLNVVAWRVPRGRSILGSSHCPKCETKLTFRDNIPVLGWLKNGGQCRYCAAPISKRYFNVEVILGSVFLYIVLLTLYSGGVSLPLRATERAIGFERNLFEPKSDLIQIVFHHLTLLCLLFTLALIRFDQLKIPRSIFTFGMIVSIAFALIFPSVQIMSWTLSLVKANFTTFDINQLLTIGFGVAAGCVLGIFWKSAPAKTELSSNIRNEESQLLSVGCMSLALVGAFLGWQSVISIVAIMFCFQLVDSIAQGIAGYRSANVPVKVFSSTLVHLTLWGLVGQLLTVLLDK